MISTLVLFAFAAILRGVGASIKMMSDSREVQRVGLATSLLAVWVAAHGAGMWVTVWPILALILVALIVSQRRFHAPAMMAALDGVAVLLLGLMAVPQMSFLPLFGVMLAIALGGFIIDFTVQRLPTWLQIGAPFGAMLAALVIVSVTPSTFTGGTRLLQSRLFTVGFSSPFSEPAEMVMGGTSPIPRVSAAELDVGAVAPTDIFLPTVSSRLYTPSPDEIVVARPIDISFNNPSYSGNPFDLQATVVFSHSSGKSHQTQMFYMGGDEWRVRFTASAAGRWSYATSSSDPELNNKTGSLDITAESGLLGFVGTDGQRWIRTGGDGEAFIPQFVMYSDPHLFYNNPSKIDADIQNFMGDHGFNGLHVKVYCRWFDLDRVSCNDINLSDPNPDLRTFEALEQLIIEVYNEGGTVHLWAWGDESRGQTPERWGYNQTVDQRLQRYIAARLGPLPGWTMGYGFDLFEWTTEEQLDTWYTYMHAHLGWYHLLGARANKNRLDQLSELMDYSSYEQHRPGYDKYVETLNTRPSKPSFSEDRFRVRDEGREKDYSLNDTRRGLWRSGMAGGVANIWGYLLDGGTDVSGSATYPNKDQIKLYFDYFDTRFSGDMIRCNDLTDGVCLRQGTDRNYIFYKEDSSSIFLDLSDMKGSQPYIALNTRTGETKTGVMNPESQTFQLFANGGTVPQRSDWAIFIGEFQTRDAQSNQHLPEADQAELASALGYPDEMCQGKGH